MRNDIVSSVVMLSVLILFPKLSYAHTISQHLQELYGQAYLPLFVLAALLPFVGIGLLAGQKNGRKKSFAFHVPFTLSLAFGVLIRFSYEIHEFFIVFNRGSILLIGIILVAVRNGNQFVSQTMTILLGLTLGMESGLRIDHGMEYRWLYLLILTAGLLIFQLFYNLSIRAHKKKSAFHLISGFTLIILGLIVILLT